MKKIFVIAALLIGIGTVFFVGPEVSAQALNGVCSQTGTDTGVCSDEQKNEDIGSLIGILVNGLLFLVGALSVVMIIAAGIRFTVGNGNAERVTGARKMITYAVAGLIISFLAYAIVNWVFNLF